MKELGRLACLGKFMRAAVYDSVCMAEEQLLLPQPGNGRASVQTVLPICDSKSRRWMSN